MTMETFTEPQPIGDIMENIQCSDMIKNALIIYEYKEATPEMLCTFIGFTDNESEMLKIFWQPVFNKKWIPTKC
jgi:hypothetical protein